VYSDQGDVTRHQDAYSCSQELVPGGQTQLLTWQATGYLENRAQLRPLDEAAAIANGSASENRPERYTTPTVIYHYLPRSTYHDPWVGAMLGECVVKRSFSASICNTPACCRIKRISCRKKILQNHPRRWTASSVTPHYSPIDCQISSRVLKFLQLIRNHKMPVCVTAKCTVCVSAHLKCKNGSSYCLLHQLTN
jgi:hypothetical protein